MVVYQGKGVYGAVAIGKVSVFKRQAATVRRVSIEDTAAELERVEAAKAAAVAKTRLSKTIKLSDNSVSGFRTAAASCFFTRESKAFRCRFTNSRR